MTIEFREFLKQRAKNVADINKDKKDVSTESISKTDIQLKNLIEGDLLMIAASLDRLVEAIERSNKKK